MILSDEFSIITKKMYNFDCQCCSRKIEILLHRRKKRATHDVQFGLYKEKVDENTQYL